MVRRVLVIDDDAAIRLSLSFLLRAKGFEVIVAEDGAEGFAMYLEHKPDIVISDMVMPGHKGIETIGKIRALNATVPIIAMSGSIGGGEASFLKRALEAGADRCLEKPFEQSELLELLDSFDIPGADEA